MANKHSSQQPRMRDVPLDFASTELSRESAFEEYLTILLREKWLLLIVAAAVFVVVAAYTFITLPVYESTAAVLVDSKGRQKMPIFDAMSGVAASNNITNELEILRSRSLAEAVSRALLRQRFVDSLQTTRIQLTVLDDSESRRNKLASVPVIMERLRNSVEYAPVRESEVIRITARSTSPDEAALIANTVAQQYVERNIDASRVQSRAVREFLQGQMSGKRQSLDTAETAVQNYMRRSGIASLDAEAAKVVEQLSQLEARRDAIDLEQSVKTRNLVSYKEELLQLEPSVARSIGESHDSYIRLLQEQLARLEVQRDVVIAQNPALVGERIYSDKLKEIDGQIGLLRKNLEDRTKSYLRSVGPGEGAVGQGNAGYLGQMKQKVIEAQMELDGLAAQRKALEGVLQEYETQFKQIPKKSIDLAKLQRERLSNEKLYLMLQEKYSESVIKEKSEFGYVNIIDPAVVPFGPVSPRKAFNLAIGLLLGLVLGVGAAFVRTYAAAKISTPEDLKRYGFTPLGTIGRNDDERRKIERDPTFKQNGRFSSRLVAHHRALSPVAESYRHLRTNLRYVRPDDPLKVILFTSANPQEGKSTTIANVAVSFAQADQKVLLIDGDMRRPSVERVFNLRTPKGLSELLTGRGTEEVCIRRNVIERLDVIPCGAIPPNPAELLGSHAMKDLLKAMKERYDIILIDSPPLFAVTDAAVLAAEADGVVLVAAAGVSPVSAVQGALEFLEGIHAQSIGVVLNNFDVRSAYGRNVKKYHYGYYNYDSGYYREEKNVKP